jgi:hypothetical protein
MWPLPKRKPAGLNARRDAYVRGMRALCGELQSALEAGEHKGILGRVGPLLEGQRDTLRRLEELDLEGDVGVEETVLALVKAQHLPRMLLALGEVFVQEEKDQALRPLQRRALDLGTELGGMTQDWVLAHQADIDLLGDLEEL